MSEPPGHGCKSQALDWMDLAKRMTDLSCGQHCPDSLLRLAAAALALVFEHAQTIPNAALAGQEWIGRAVDLRMGLAAAISGLGERMPKSTPAAEA